MTLIEARKQTPKEADLGHRQTPLDQVFSTVCQQFDLKLTQGDLLGSVNNPDANMGRSIVISLLLKSGVVPYNISLLFHNIKLDAIKDLNQRIGELEQAYPGFRDVMHSLGDTIDVLRERRNVAKIQQQIRTVSERFTASPDGFYKRGRILPPTEIQIAIYLANQAGLSIKEVCVVLEIKDEGTVKHSLVRVAQQLSRDPEFKEELTDAEDKVDAIRAKRELQQAISQRISRGY
ncbi:MAG: hypothetical protein A2958_01200 [Candidatus Levybacteria bacterium RIFCSPLOWO2_01_FULL_38_13]|nr:MAG: hypothetical protein A2629_01060 [Candidatus Levybacteria bacterium RIFCSPHIGHO2_01_FULL_41_15]OGH35771.1 MAG: hypothetical protein A2958_01200 [Candidatus Levybacteria bacterium RIFCSPLOWO2_01_FULL_38_13]